MPANRGDIVTMPNEAARRLIMSGCRLLADPTRKATPAAVRTLIEQMGYVQIDSINVVLRAHHHILAARFDDYEPRMLAKGLERDRTLFEHWTHDASIIRIDWLPRWRLRFEEFANRPLRSQWWAKRIGDANQVIDAVRTRIAEEGPLFSRDFEKEPHHDAGPWWGWKPAKAALEYLWRTGELAVSHRHNFHKAYDLTERIFPWLADCEPDGCLDSHVDWECREALDRLGVATPREIAQYISFISARQAKSWCEQAAKRGEVEPVLVETADDSPPRPAFALHDWRRRAARVKAAPDRMRLLSPFDPLIRDRERLERLFGFQYRFEAFTPAAKRIYGYYVLPMLDGDSIVGRVDPALDRKAGVLRLNSVFWEPGVKVTKIRRRRLEDAARRLARSAGADRIEIGRTAHRAG